MTTSTETTLLVETSPGHCHGETLERLAEEARKFLAERKIQINAENGVQVWSALEEHLGKYSMFPHNAQAKSRLELVELVFYRVLAT